MRHAAYLDQKLPGACAASDGPSADREWAHGLEPWDAAYLPAANQAQTVTSPSSCPAQAGLCDRLLYDPPTTNLPPAEEPSTVMRLAPPAPVIVLAVNVCCVVSPKEACRYVWAIGNKRLVRFYS